MTIHLLFLLVKLPLIVAISKPASRKEILGAKTIGDKETKTLLSTHSAIFAGQYKQCEHFSNDDYSREWKAKIINGVCDSIFCIITLCLLTPTNAFLMTEAR